MNNFKSLIGQRWNVIGNDIKITIFRTRQIFYCDVQQKEIHRMKNYFHVIKIILPILRQVPMRIMNQIYLCIHAFVIVNSVAAFEGGFAPNITSSHLRILKAASFFSENWVSSSKQCIGIVIPPNAHTKSNDFIKLSHALRKVAKNFTFYTYYTNVTALDRKVLNQDEISWFPFKMNYHGSRCRSFGLLIHLGSPISKKQKI